MPMSPPCPLAGRALGRSLLCSYFHSSSFCLWGTLTLAVSGFGLCPRAVPRCAAFALTPLGGHWPPWDKLWVVVFIKFGWFLAISFSDSFPVSSHPSTFCDFRYMNSDCLLLPCASAYWFSKHFFQSLSLCDSFSLTSIATSPDVFLQ